MICVARRCTSNNRLLQSGISMSLINNLPHDAVEFLTDVASPEFHPLAAKAKDVAAGAVLIAAIGSAVIGFLVLGPYVLLEINKWS
jgi:diacylglycerol kinase (ATP)